MGIELPSPVGETRVAPVTSGESPQRLYNQETSNSLSTVENKSSEVPASQEIATGRGVGDQFNQSSTNDASATTQTLAYQPSAGSSVSLDDVPVVAADEDLIEKQWVDSVKRIIKETRNDPFGQGEAISKLQADYLQKRYGKTIGEGGQQ